MAIRPEAAVAGVVLYSRKRHKMGNTTLSTLGEWTVRVLESYDPEMGYAVCSWNGNRPERYYAVDLRRLYDWSIHNDNESEIVRGIWSSIVKVTRRRKCATCETRHASPECPKEET